ncbi:MAG: hypothetical protein OHK0024_36200 [Thalassobaculales bacterium]
MAVLAAGLGLAFAAGAQDAVKARQDGMKAIGGNFRAINQALQAGTLTPDLAGKAGEIKASAARIPAWFPAGSTGGNALPPVWEKPADFAAAAKRLEDAAAALEAALRSGGLDAAKAAAPAVGQSCGGCHGTFRARI